MVERTYTGTIKGLTPLKIEVEVDATRGLPNLIFIGLATKAVAESKERITSALINCGIRLKSKRTIVNLAPADIKKSSPTFELAIAVGMLKMHRVIKFQTTDTIFFGELSLSGELKPIRGALPLVIAAKKMNFKKVFLPASNQKEVSIIQGIKIYPLHHLQEFIDFSQGKRKLSSLKNTSFASLKNNTKKNASLNFKNIYDQKMAKRALVIAAAGGHNVLMVGPPGSGKSLLAQTLVSILPPLTKKETIELTTLYAVAPTTQKGIILIRPFRTPHHTASHVGLIGGGNKLSPGEISLAHHGILFLDEFTEFDRRSLEALRQPLENKQITLVRAGKKITYPANFTLIAAANPCPCGWRGSRKKECRCSSFDFHRYKRKLSGPILDRIDLFVRVNPVDLNKLKITSNKNNQTKANEQINNSDVLREQVTKARKIQQRFLSKFKIQTNAQLSSAQLKHHLRLTPSAQKTLQQAIRNFEFTTRGYFKLIKISQTIANLSQRTEIDATDLLEALQYRQMQVFA